MIYALFVFALAVAPYTAFNGLPFLGELRGEFSAHVFLIAMGLSLVLASPLAPKKEAKTGKMYGLPFIMLAMLGAITLSFVANVPTILASHFMDRSGLSKFITSTILVFYGFSLAALTYNLAGKHAWDRLILKPLCISVVLCAILSVFEVGGRFIGPLGGLYKVMTTVIHGSNILPEGDTRLRSFGFEPPDFANSAGYIWPWLLAATQFEKGQKRLVLFGLWLVLNVMIVLSESRTSLVVVSGLMGVFLALRFVYLPLEAGRAPEKYIPLTNLLFFLLLPIFFLVLGLNADTLVRVVISSDRVSNLSRLASMVTGLRLFVERPFFGWGFGQYAFHAAQFMPSWGFLSYEVRDWLSGASGYWPAVYSLYPRFGADMGIVGILVWIGIWLGLARAVLMATLQHRRETGVIPATSYPLILGCFCVLLAGVPNDSVRSPMIWINMGLACRYLFEIKRARLARLLAAEAAAKEAPETEPDKPKRTPRRRTKDRDAAPPLPQDDAQGLLL